jgi:hypothetical protein
MPKPKPAHKPIPSFKSEEAEREFWTTADSSEYVDWSAARAVRFPSLRPSTTAISVRLPDTLLAELKILANERDCCFRASSAASADQRMTRRSNVFARRYSASPNHLPKLSGQRSPRQSPSSLSHGVLRALPTSSCAFLVPSISLLAACGNPESVPGLVEIRVVPPYCSVDPGQDSRSNTEDTTHGKSTKGTHHAPASRPARHPDGSAVGRWHRRAVDDSGADPVGPPRG